MVQNIVYSPEKSEYFFQATKMNALKCKGGYKM